MFRGSKSINKCASPTIISQEVDTYAHVIDPPMGYDTAIRYFLGSNGLFSFREKACDTYECVDPESIST